MYINDNNNKYYMYTHVYIYIYIERERYNDRPSVAASRRKSLVLPRLFADICVLRSYALSAK